MDATCKMCQVNIGSKKNMSLLNVDRKEWTSQENPKIHEVINIHEIYEALTKKIPNTHDTKYTNSVFIRPSFGQPLVSAIMAYAFSFHELQIKLMVLQ